MGTFKDITPEKEESIDPRKKAERERDSIGRLNKFSMFNVVKNAPVIDPKKIGNAFFNKLDFNKLIAYSYDGSHEQVLIENSWTIDKQIGLTQKQANTILSLLSRKNTFGTYSAGCFEPRLALVLYKDHSSIVQISICMDCNNLNYDPKINAIDGGLSEKGRKGIIAFCKELKFPYGELKN
ncbi:hypothetical protein [Fluviicola chungangensis]|uniref:Uncharacterized protein n=1 Tax=Fluviicola chungangensis TaxID=2597671 RepID=A0A556MJ18_9FLAO|nr:hypothetical protein [Fluviicola chungangensis]TSJ39863.1 hypothetical protein FO442_17560 [Fluviicola chungangensis]